MPDKVSISFFAKTAEINSPKVPVGPARPQIANKSEQKDNSGLKIYYRTIVLKTI